MSEVSSTQNEESSQLGPSEPTKSICATIGESKNTESITTDNIEPQNTEAQVTTSDKEKELLDMVFSLENEKQNLIEESRERLGKLRKECEVMFAKVREESQLENEKLKKRNAQIEQELTKKVALGQSSSKPSKKEQDDVLTKAKTLLFEKTKVCKQQERHIEMLKTQVETVKEVLNITKEMLNLRNTEVEHMQARLDTIDLRVKAEKDKQALYEKKLTISKQMYNDLRKEYDCQTEIYKQMKSTYEEKNQILTVELERISASGSKSDPKTTNS